MTSLSGESVESLWEFVLEKALSFGPTSAMSDAASLSSSSGCVKIQSSARSRLLFWKKYVLKLESLQTKRVDAFIYCCPVLKPHEAVIIWLHITWGCG